MTEKFKSRKVGLDGKVVSSEAVYEIGSLDLSMYDEEILGLKNGTTLMDESPKKPEKLDSDNPLTKRVPWGMENSTIFIPTVNLLQQSEAR